jgi:hypothetical protein
MSIDWDRVSGLRIVRQSTVRWARGTIAAVLAGIGLYGRMSVA